MKTTAIAIPSLIITLLFLSVYTIAQAHTIGEAEHDAAHETQADTVETRGVERTERLQNIASTTAARQDERIERRTTLAETAQKRVMNLAANISNRIDAAVSRLSNIAERLESRMEKLATAGVDTTAAEEELATAKELLSSIADRMDTIDSDIYRTITSETPRESWKTIRAFLVEIKTDLGAAKAALRATVASLKSAVAEAEVGRGMSEAVANEQATSSETE
jgi:F0F1-type ATP synthase membrane subunit b/b'